MLKNIKHERELKILVIILGVCAGYWLFLNESFSPKKLSAHNPTEQKKYNEFIDRREKQTSKLPNKFKE